MHRLSVGVLAVLLVISTGALGYLLYDQHRELTEVRDQVDGLHDQINSLADSMELAAQQTPVIDDPGGEEVNPDLLRTLVEADMVLNFGVVSRDSRRKDDLHDVRTAFELYYDDHLTYPVADSYSALRLALVPEYLSEFPADPVNTGEMTYRYSGGASMYTLTAYLEDTRTNYSVYSAN